MLRISFLVVAPVVNYQKFEFESFSKRCLTSRSYLMPRSQIRLILSMSIPEDILLSIILLSSCLSVSQIVSNDEKKKNQSTLHAPEVRLNLRTLPLPITYDIAPQIFSIYDAALSMVL
ncbi:hypothetical protein BCV71DRAFT_71625 [Rhizopus microsporus]|uniref:Uncharacterized protein n=1 Tax=Rhizopus microsporus TaxID=58291 RepID=A0A1X0SG73_RHIZD|nr:hypothetical protein BCV71DRAFT_71625 [Rhizopus microsporus]